MKIPVVFTTLLATASAACALTIQLDYSYDSAAGNFFGRNPLAKAALEKAAADLSALVNTPLGAIPNDVFTGTNGDSTFGFNWGLQFENPAVPGDMVARDSFSIQSNVLTIYVGMRSLSGSTLGQGGPAGVYVTAFGNASPDEIVGAVAQAEAASDQVMTRNGGPVMGSVSGSVTVGVRAEYTLEYGALGGQLWFDNDRNNDGNVDSDPTLASFWHFDPNTDVAAGKNDLYSVALHEMLHVLGVGTSDSWTDLAAGTTWLGAEAAALNGGIGLNLISSGGDHLRSGLSSVSLFDGAVQEVAMDPSLTTGERKYLTQMDLAILNDLGYTVSPVPEPSVGLMLISGLGLLRLRTRRARS